ncbi:prepilin-type N-terminal cleavage/methylation domain-containing protein [Emcibacter nanhaiensis]|nr:prepilin-type N-terminal cleavage/methylation domain-containing protein [Emcibacter nanhaiensis]
MRTSWPANNPHAGDQGYTLLEILVVIAILALLAGLAGPRLFSGNARTELTRLVQESRQLVLDTGLRARQTARPQALVLDLTDKRLANERDSLSLAGLDRLDMVTARELGEQKDQGQILFYPDGSSTGGEIRLGKGPFSEVLKIDWLTGQVTRAPAS